MTSATNTLYLPVKSSRVHRTEKYLVLPLLSEKMKSYSIAAWPPRSCSKVRTDFTSAAHLLGTPTRLMMACFRVGTRWNGTPLYIWILVDIEKELKARPTIFSTILVVVEDAKIFLTTSYAFEIVSRTKPVVVSF